jgi:molybdenum cofactor biosynthesis enzyme
VGQRARFLRQGGANREQHRITGVNKAKRLATDVPETDRQKVGWVDLAAAKRRKDALAISCRCRVRAQTGYRGGRGAR